MTEEEAKSKWCPFARIARMETDDGASWNRLQSSVGSALPKDASCAASKCMAWRWSHGVYQTDTMFWSKGDPEKTPEGDGWEPTTEPQSIAGRAFSRSWRRLHPARHGFCGLAGEEAH